MAQMMKMQMSVNTNSIPRQKRKSVLDGGPSGDMVVLLLASFPEAGRSPSPSPSPSVPGSTTSPSGGVVVGEASLSPLPSAAAGAVSPGAPVEGPDSAALEGVSDAGRVSVEEAASESIVVETVQCLTF